MFSQPNYSLAVTVGNWRYTSVSSKWVWSSLELREYFSLRRDRHYTSLRSLGFPFQENAMKRECSPNSVSASHDFGRQGPRGVGRPGGVVWGTRYETWGEGTEEEKGGHQLAEVVLTKGHWSTAQPKVRCQPNRSVHLELELHPLGQSSLPQYAPPASVFTSIPTIPRYRLAWDSCSSLSNHFSKPTYSPSSTNILHHLCPIHDHLSINCLNCSLSINLHSSDLPKKSVRPLSVGPKKAPVHNNNPYFFNNYKVLLCIVSHFTQTFILLGKLDTKHYKMLSRKQPQKSLVTGFELIKWTHKHANKLSNRPITIWPSSHITLICLKTVQRNGICPSLVTSLPCLPITQLGCNFVFSL